MENSKIRTIEDSIEALKNASKIIEEAHAELETGACLFVPPSGPSWCRQMTPEACAAIKGTYLGGACP